MMHKTKQGFGTSELLFALSVGILIVVVAFPMLLIFFSTPSGWMAISTLLTW